MTRSRNLTAAVLLAALALALLAGARSSDARRFPVATCTFDRANATLTVVATNTFMSITRRGDEIAVAQSGTGARTCAGAPTVTNVDLIRIEASTGAIMTLDLRGGPFAPGLTSEADGSPEIEVEADLDFADLTIRGGAKADAIAVGTDQTGAQAANLNANEARADSDLTFTGPTKILTVEGGGGDDMLDAGASRSFGRGFLGTLAIDGGAGDDRLDGGPEGDFLVGGAGTDRIRGYGGRDTVRVRDGARDRVACGAGRDRADVDAKDRLRGCERVRA